MKLIIWDWNGTLLNDVDACVDSMNIMLEKRGMKDLSHERYKRIFTFPVQNYYSQLGFNFEKDPFEELSVEYIDLYKQQAEKSSLQQGAGEILQYFKDKKTKQIILSASEQVSLENQVKQRNIYHYFDSLIGLKNIYAKSKLENAKRFIKESQNEFEQIIFIGDTYHDLEVAHEINAKCILFANGHQILDSERINGNAIIVDSLVEIANLTSDW